MEYRGGLEGRIFSTGGGGMLLLAWPMTFASQFCPPFNASANTTHLEKFFSHEKQLARHLIKYLLRFIFTFFLTCSIVSVYLVDF